MDHKDFAYDMYKKEHDRWKDWTFFFLGSIVSIFLVWKELREILPLWIPALIASLLSLAWITVSLSIRASTNAWEATIKELEIQEKNKTSFETFRRHLCTGKHQWRDLLDTVNIFAKEWWTIRLFSVTRTLTWLGILLFVFFIFLFLISLTISSCNYK